VTFDTLDDFTDGWKLLSQILDVLGTNETVFQEMVSEDYIRLQDAATQVQYKFTDRSSLTWPAHVLIWPMNELDTTGVEVTGPGNDLVVSGNDGTKKGFALVVLSSWVIRYFFL